MEGGRRVGKGDEDGDGYTFGGYSLDLSTLSSINYYDLVKHSEFVIENPVHPIFDQVLHSHAL